MLVLSRSTLRATWAMPSEVVVVMLLPGLRVGRSSRGGLRAGRRRSLRRGAGDVRRVVLATAAVIGVAVVDRQGVRVRHRRLRGGAGSATAATRDRWAD